MIITKIIRISIKPFLYTIRHIWFLMNPVGYAKSLGVTISGKVYFYGKNPNMFSSEPWLISIGDNVHIAAEVKFITHDSGTIILPNHADGFVICGNINIGNNVCIGQRAIILPGVTIGDNCIIGAGAIVTKDIPSNSTAAGNPAKVLGTIKDYLAKIKNIKEGSIPRYYSNLDSMFDVKKVNLIR